MWQACFLKPFRTFIGVGWFSCSYFHWDFYLFAWQDALAASRLAASRFEGSAPPPWWAASACQQHNWSQASVLSPSVEFVRRVLVLMCPADMKKGAPTKQMVLAAAARRRLPKLLSCLAVLPLWIGLHIWWVGITPLVLWTVKSLSMCIVSGFIGGRIPCSQHPSDCAQLTPTGTSCY